jgi:2-dehydro-3-deoxyphosphogluconate aldolase/(4S)-4-hydroxy-2-oxoglutarate aldolase
MNTKTHLPSQEVLKRIAKAGVVPVVVLEDPNKAVPLGRTLLEAGLDLVEITLRTEKALEGISLLSKTLPELQEEPSPLAHVS